MFKTFKEAMDFLRTFDMTQNTEMANYVRDIYTHDYYFRRGYDTKPSEFIDDNQVRISQFLYDMNYIVYGEEVANQYDKEEDRG